MIYLLLLSALLHFTLGDIETLHFESACLHQPNFIHLNLHCSQYEHIQIVRVIYGYTKQELRECQFSIYDCIQEGTSNNIHSCNGKQTCLINLTKSEMLSTAITTHGVPICPDFNYIQVNYACVPDSKDICDSWKDEGPVIHLSHTYSKDRQYNRCHCKIRSSIPNGQVLLHAREMNRQDENLQSLIIPRQSNIDCKKTTYLEIATDRFERKCMDMLPSTSNALFGSGSHNFTLTYVKNDLFSELFFFLELKASPIKKDHNVQIICNWKRRQTTVRTTKTTTVPLPTTSIISTTIPMTRKRKSTTISMQRAGQLSRLDLIRYRPGLQPIEIEDTTADIEEVAEEEEEHHEEEEQEQEQEYAEETTTVVRKTKKARRSTLSTKTTTTTDEDEEWLRILSLANIESPSKQFLSINNRTFVTAAAQPSIINSEEKIRHSSSTSRALLIILLILILLTLLILTFYCLKVKQPECIRRMKLNFNVAFLFCCEAGKLLFCSSTNSRSISHTPASTRRPSPDYQSSEYYIDETGTNHNCRTIQSIYDGGGGSKSIYSIDYDEETEYTTKYDRHHDGSC
jgi:hypothetical protein